ncbi:MAG: YceI family protein [Saprospiraceae bacterium]|nr:YceI family protein [Saprospiraceae bacterium]
MPAIFRNTILLAFSLFSFFSCKNDPKTETVQATPKVDTINLNPVPTEGSAVYSIVEGVVEWSGTKTLKKTAHQGTITVESGELMVNQGQLLSGKVTLDMNSITVTDIKDPGERRDLESHLMDSDFFEANNFPKAEFVFSEVLPSTMPNFNWVLSGSLTIKDKTHSVNIPVKVSIEGDMLRAVSPAFPINRTQWGVTFQSGILGTARDKMIDDMVPLTLKIVAKKN